MENNDMYKISKFDWVKDLPHDTGWFITISAKSRGGKGIYTHRLLEKMHRAKKLNIKDAYLFSSSAETQTDSFPMIKHNRFTNYDDDFVTGIIEDNKEQIKKEMASGKSKQKAIKDNTILMIIDDLAGGQVFRSKSLIMLSTMGRHVGINVILLTQSLASSVPSICRKNSSVVIAYPALSHRVMQLLSYEFSLMSLGGMSLKECREFLMSVWRSKPYTALVILQHKTNVTRFESIMRYDRVTHPIEKTSKYLMKQQIDKKKKKQDDDDDGEVLMFRRKNRSL